MDGYFGFEDVGVAKEVLKSLAHMDETELEDLSVFAEDYAVDREALRRTLNWAELLHLVHRVGSDVWRIDPVVGRVLVGRVAGA